MTSLLHDVRYAVRQLLRTPGFTAAAVITLALGIGVNTAFFAVVNAVIFRPVRAFDVENVWRPVLNSVRWHGGGPPFAHFRFLEDELPEGIVAIDSRMSNTVLAHTRGYAERVEAEYISGGHAAVFGLDAQAGRFISREDDRGLQRTVVISDRLWREWFAGDRSIVGTAFMKVNDNTYLIVGVAPFGYRGNIGFGLGNIDLWMPLNAVLGPAGNSPRTIGTGFTSTVVRLAPGVTPEEAAGRIHASIKDLPMPPRRQDPYVVALQPAANPEALRRPGYLLMTFSAFILFAACANLANMLYTRGAHRAAEVAVRQSLGATSARIFRLFVAEAALIAVIASSLGLAFALSVTRSLQTAFPSFRDRATRVSIDLTPDYRVFVWAFGAGVLAILAVGVITAWQASRVPPLRAMATGDAATSITRTSRRVRLALVAIQVTASVVLLMGAGLFLRQTHGAFENRVTFDTRPVGTARIELGKHGYNDSRALAFLRRLEENVRAIKGVEAAAISDGVPAGVSMGGTGAVLTAAKRGVPEPRYIDGTYKRTGGFIVSTSPGFLATLNLPLEAGRDINEGDREGAPLVVVISRNAADRLFGDEDPVGRRLMLGNEGQWRTVVGVCANPAAAKRTLGPRETPQASMVLVPYEQRYQPPLNMGRGGPYDERFRREKLIVFRSSNVRGHLDAVRAAVRNIDADVAVYDAAPVDESILSWVGPLRAARLVMGTLALIALAISVVGIYGVLAFIVARRRREFGIRIALGAARRQVLKMVFDDALHLLLVGLLAGVFVAAVGERVVTTRRFGVPPNEISTWAVVLLLILTVGLTAALIPARRAAGIDPNVALRDL